MHIFKPYILTFPLTLPTLNPKRALPPPPPPITQFDKARISAKKPAMLTPSDADDAIRKPTRIKAPWLRALRGLQDSC